MKFSSDASTHGATLTITDLGSLVDQVPRVSSADDAAQIFEQLEVMARQVEATKAALIAHVHRHDLHRLDGYIKLASWVRSVARLSHREASDLSRAGRLIADYPKVGAFYFSGTMGTDHLRRLASLHQNKRVAAYLPRFMPLFLEWSQTMDADTFTTATLRWEQLTDADGTHRHTECIHDDRDATINTFSDATFIQGKVGNLQGALMHQVHDRFTQRELDNDLAERDRLGLSDLPRTSRQRRADALHNIFAAAAESLPPSIEPLVNIVIDANTYETALRCIETNSPLPTLTGSPIEFPHRRCETISGAAIDPIEAVSMSLIGHVRRVVMNTSSTVIDLGRRSRLFTGASREAIFIRGTRCIWPGCGSRHTQADHITPWSEGGTTSPDNGTPLCPRHNRLKTTGYTTTRRPDGRFDVARPDGTLIAPL